MVAFSISVKKTALLLLHGEIMKLGIDVATVDVKKMIAELSEVEGVINVTEGGMYREDQIYSQVHLELTKSVQYIEDWLYEHSTVDYVGTFPR